MQQSSYPAPVPDPQCDYCLFLDFDGTLVDLAPTPDDVQVDPGLISLLGQTAADLNGALAIVTGRTIAAIDSLISPLNLPVAGIHGSERRTGRGIFRRTASTDEKLDTLRAGLQELAMEHEGLLLEDKGVALAIHYRLAPYLRDEVHSRVAALMSGLEGRYEPLQGNAVLEVRPAVHNKALAVEEFMRETPFMGKVPIYIGDDVTDYDGFAAVERYSGMAIAVGTHVSTRWRLRDPAAVRAWLEDFRRMSVRCDGV